MTSALAKVLQKGLARGERLAGNPFFVYKGQKIPCSVGGTLKSDYSLGMGGVEEGIQFQLVVRKNLFPFRVDSGDLPTLDSDFGNWRLDNLGDPDPWHDKRQLTLDLWIAARKALTVDSDLTIDSNCFETIDSNNPWPFDSSPLVNSIAVTIDDAGRVSLDGLYVLPEALPGCNPLTIDSQTVYISDNVVTIDRHIDCFGYFDPVAAMLPRLSGWHLDTIDAEIETRKAEWTPNIYATTYDDNCLTIDDNADSGLLTIDDNAAPPTLDGGQTVDATVDPYALPPDLTMDEDGDGWQRRARIPGVYQEDQGMDFTSRPAEGAILQYQGREYRVISVEDAGAFDAFYKLNLGNAWN